MDPHYGPLLTCLNVHEPADGRHGWHGLAFAGVWFVWVAVLTADAAIQYDVSESIVHQPSVAALVMCVPYRDNMCVPYRVNMCVI